MPAIGYAGSGAPVTSVNTEVGDVILDAADVGAEPAIAPATTADYRRGDETWQPLNKAAVAGIANVVDGPVSATDEALVRYDTASGKLVQNSAVRVTDAGTLQALAAIFTGSVTVTGGNLTIVRTDNTGAYRLRVTGSGLDFDIAGLDVFISKFANADFTGTQSNNIRLESAGPHLIGRVQFGTSPFDNVHDIDSSTGVAALGKKNGLGNIRFSGQKATSGAPTTGTWIANDLIIDSIGVWHLCTAGGTPGTWT
jgi:hypothetical protein